MQLGELQNQIKRFERRGVSVIALSVDSPTDSEAMVERLGLTYDLASDSDQATIKAFRVQNPDTRELAIHAVYIVDEASRVVYRKVARRRPVSAELIDAIDAFQGTYPQNDPAEPRRRINVAYPQNNFQALLEVSAVDALLPDIDPVEFKRIVNLISAMKLDDALFAFKRLVLASKEAHSQDDLLGVAAWMVRQSLFASNSTAIDLGKELRTRLNRVGELEAAEQNADPEQHDEILHTLAAARAALTRVRADIERQADEWNLRFAKSHLRGYREVVLAAFRN